MALDPDDPDLERVIEVANAELLSLEAATARRLLVIYERERDALLERINKVAETQDTFGVRQARVIKAALDDAIGRLGGDLVAEQQKAIDKAIGLGAEAGAREAGQLEGAFGSPAASRAIASLAGVIPHRAVAAAQKLRVFRILTEMAEGDTRTTLIELDSMARAAITRGMIQGQSSRQMVPFLRDKIRKKIDSKTWELERTLRTGTNAAVNIGHNQAYLQAKELLPDLKRQGQEHLGLAAKTGGRRENHPFSKLLHGAVAELDRPWVIASPKHPVMFWPYDDSRGAYVGKRYPAHLWERGREVPYREAWERRRGIQVAAQALPPGYHDDQEEDIVPLPNAKPTVVEGVHVDKITASGVSKAVADSILAGVQDPGLLDFLEAHPLSRLTIKPAVEDPGVPGRKLAGLTFKNGSMEIAAKVTQPHVGKFRAGQMWSVSGGAKTKLGSVHAALHHEIAEHMMFVGGKEATDKIRKVWAELKDDWHARRPGDGPRPVTRYAETAWREYFSESLSAFFLHRQDLLDFDPVGHKMVVDILDHLGVPHG